MPRTSQWNAITTINTTINTDSQGRVRIGITQVNLAILTDLRSDEAQGRQLLRYSKRVGPFPSGSTRLMTFEIVSIRLGHPPPSRIVLVDRCSTKTDIMNAGVCRQRWYQNCRSINPSTTSRFSFRFLGIQFAPWPRPVIQMGRRLSIMAPTSPVNSTKLQTLDLETVALDTTERSHRTTGTRSMRRLENPT